MDAVHYAKSRPLQRKGESPGAKGLNEEGSHPSRYKSCAALQNEERGWKSTPQEEDAPRTRWK